MEDPPNIYDCKAYACYLKNEEKLLKSTSGGVFQEIAGSVISRGGVVFGAALTDDFEVRHQEADTLAGLEKILKSINAQNMKSLLKSPPIFTGRTPCAVFRHPVPDCRTEIIFRQRIRHPFDSRSDLPWSTE